MITDNVADLLTRIRNAQKAGHPTVTAAASKFKENILTVLKDEGYIASFEKIKDSEGKESIKVYLKYLHNNIPAIKEIRRVSKSGRRYYAGKDNIPVYKNGLGVAILSTSKGILSGVEAKKQGVGGEIICSVF